MPASAASARTRWTIARSPTATSAEGQRKCVINSGYTLIVAAAADDVTVVAVLVAEVDFVNAQLSK